MEKLELSKAEKDLNEIGILAGVHLSAIPFYYFYKMIKHLGLLYNISKDIFIKMLVTLFAIVGSVLFLIKLIIDMYSVNEFSTVNLDYESYLFYVILIVVILLFVCGVTGFSIKSYIEENEMDNDTRLELAKLSGINLKALPLYAIVKTASLSSKVKEYSNGDITLIPFYIFYVLDIFVGGMFKIIVGLVLLVVQISLGLSLNDLKAVIIKE